MACAPEQAFVGGELATILVTRIEPVDTLRGLVKYRANVIGDGQRQIDRVLAMGQTNGHVEHRSWNMHNGKLHATRLSQRCDNLPLQEHATAIGFGDSTRR